MDPDIDELYNHAVQASANGGVAPPDPASQGMDPDLAKELLQQYRERKFKELGVSDAPVPQGPLTDIERSAIAKEAAGRGAPDEEDDGEEDDAAAAAEPPANPGAQYTVQHASPDQRQIDPAGLLAMGRFGPNSKPADATGMPQGSIYDMAARGNPNVRSLVGSVAPAAAPQAAQARSGYGDASPVAPDAGGPLRPGGPAPMTENDVLRAVGEAAPSVAPVTDVMRNSPRGLGRFPAALDALRGQPAEEPTQSRAEALRQAVARTHPFTPTRVAAAARAVWDPNDVPLPLSQQPPPPPVDKDFKNSSPGAYLARRAEHPYAAQAFDALRSVTGIENATERAMQDRRALGQPTPGVASYNFDPMNPADITALARKIAAERAAGQPVTSDRRRKINIRPGNSLTMSFLRALAGRTDG